MKRVLFVCLGNICRSPTAEAVLNHLIQQNLMHDLLSCGSAGAGAYHCGEGPDPYMSGPETFETVLDYCEAACQGILTWARNSE